jgi:hypothetical protein
VAQDATQGGSIIVTYKDDVSTLDPAIGYDWQNWSMIKSLFDGLMDYEPGTTELMPDLASDYTVSEDGKTYTFTLRQGVKFHNGREMTAEDVKYSLDRVVRPETQSPGAGFFDSIEGSTRCLRRGRQPEGRRGRRPLHGALHPVASRRALPAQAGPELRPRRGEGSGRGRVPISARTRSARAPSSWPNGRSASAWCSSATRTTTAKACPPRHDHLRGRPGADRGHAAPAARRGRHRRRRHPAGQVPRGHPETRNTRT